MVHPFHRHFVFFHFVWCATSHFRRRGRQETDVCHKQRSRPTDANQYKTINHILSRVVRKRIYWIRKYDIPGPVHVMLICAVHCTTPYSNTGHRVFPFSLWNLWIRIWCGDNEDIEGDEYFLCTLGHHYSSWHESDVVDQFAIFFFLHFVRCSREGERERKTEISEFFACADKK